MPITPDEFRQRLLTNNPDNIVDELILCDGATHVQNTDIDRIKKTLAEKFGIQATEINLWIVGSAKLGFSIHRKITHDGSIYPRYRPFGVNSDIDVAVVSTPIFEQIWANLSLHAHSHTYLPWNSGRLGDYLICGWWRPDHFPMGFRLSKCDDWRDCFYMLSRDYRYGRKKVRGGLFYSIDHLRQYLRRDVIDCMKEEELSI